jgi:hypothetical protein
METKRARDNLTPDLDRRRSRNFKFVHQNLRCNSHPADLRQALLIDNNLSDEVSI